MSKTQKTTRKALALLLVLAMCLSLMPTFAFAADDVTFSKLTTGSIEDGKEYMFVGVSGGGSGSDSTKGYALANNDTYGTSSSDGTSGQKFNISSTGSTVKISSDMAQYVTWEAVKSGDGIAFKCGDKYLSAASNSSVQMSDTPTAFTVSDLAVKDGSKTLCYGSNSLGQSYVFNFNSSTSGNSKAVTVYVKDDGTGGSTDPEVRTVAIEATKTTATTKDVTIAVGETINISVTHGSGEAKTFTNVSADTSVASVERGSSFSISKSDAGTVTVKGLKNGSTTITCTGSGSAQGSKYIAIINLTVGEGGDEPDVPPVGGKSVDIKASTSGASKEASIAVDEVLTINLENGSGSSKTYTISVDKPGVASADPESTIQISGSGKGEIKVTGLTDGVAVIKCTASGNSGTYSATVTVTVGEGGDEPDVPPVGGQKVDIKAETGTAKADAAIAVGEVLTINVTHSSRADKSFKNVSSDPTVASVESGSSFSISSSQTGTLTVKGLKDGVTKITCTGTSTSGSTYIAEITVTVGEGGSDEPDVPPVSGKSVDVKASTSGASKEESIAIGEVLTINLENGSGSSKTYTISVDKPGVASADPESTIQLSGSGKGAIKVTGLADGVAVIKCSTPGGGGTYSATVTVTVGNGGGTDPEVKADVELAPIAASEGTSSAEKTIAVDDKIIVRLTNKGSSTYTFNVSSSADGVASVEPNGISIESGKTGDVVITGLKDGKTTITFANENQYGAQYQRVATLTLTVGNGGSEEPAGKSINITAASGGAARDASIDVGEVLTVNLTNGSTYSEKEYSIVVNGACAKADTEVLKLAKSATGSFTVEGLADGTAVITCTAESGSGSNYTATITLTVGKGGSTDPEPSTKEVSIEATKTTATTKDVTIAAGETLNIKVNHKSGESKTFTNVSADTSVASVESGESFSISSSQTGTVTVKGLKEGKTTITCTGSGSAQGSKYIAIINLTVGSGGSDDPTPTGDAKFTKLTSGNIEVGKEYMFVGTSGSSSTSGYALADNDNYNVKNADGVSGQKCTLTLGDTLTVSADLAQYITWKAVQSGNGIAFQCGSKYLSAASNSSIQMSSTPVVFTVSGLTVKDGSKTLCYGSNSLGSDYIFNFNSSTSGNSKPVTVYVKESGGTDPIVPTGSGVNLGFTSDVHDSVSNLDSWQKNVNKAIDPDLEYMMFCGDYSYSSGSGYKTAFNNIVSTTTANVKNGGIYTSGNHDYSNAGTAAGGGLQSYFTDTPGFHRIGEAVRTDTYIVYCFGAAAGDVIGSFTDNDIQALTEYLQSAPNDRPIFILSHFPLHYISSRTITNADKVITLLNDYPNTVFVWGHNHSQGGENNYGKVLVSGNSIKYTSSKSLDIKFTYACAGAMISGQQEPYDGLVANIDEGTVTFTYYDDTGKAASDPVTVQVKQGHTHVYGDASYTWSKDLSSCTASRSCTVAGCTSVQTETAQTVKTTTKPTCTASGKDVYTATFTNSAFAKQTQEVTLDPVDHSFGDPTYKWSDDYSSCTATRKCSECLTEENATVGSESKTVPATCTAEGSITYTATFAGDVFKTQTKTVGIDKLPHSYGDVSYVWAEDGSKCTASRTCTACPAVESEDGNVEQTAHVDATCTVDGSTTYTASFKNEAFTGSTKTVAIKSVGHIPGASVQENVVDASCTVAGSYDEVVYCTECVEELSRVHKEGVMLPHSFGDVTYTWTETDNGWSCEANRKCANCTAEETEVGNVKQTAHVDVTCTVDGSTTYTASFENAAFTGDTKTVVIEHKGHISGDPVQENIVEATCKDAGSYDEVVYCTECRTELSRTQKTIEKSTVHTPVVDAAVEATCTATGLTEGSHCDVCKKVLVEQKVVDMKDHTSVTDAAVKATCTEAGLTEGSHCDVCKKILVAQEIVPALGHDFQNGECTRCHEKQPTGTVYTLADKFVMGNTYLIVSVKDGKGVALTNNNNTFAMTSVTVSGGKIMNSDLAKAEWEAKPTKSGSNLIGLYNDGHVLKVNGDSLSITTSATSYNAGGFGYTSANHVSYPYGSNPKDYFIGFANDTFKAASSENNLGEVYIFVKEGGTDPVDPPVTGKTVEVTPTTSNPKESISIDVNESFTLKLTNSSTNSDYTFTLSFDKDGVVSADSMSVAVAQSKTGELVITGVKDGTVKITVTNGNGSYARTAEITVTVGEGGDEPTGENVPVEATTAGTNTKLTLEVGEEIVIALTHASRASKDFTIEINNSGIAQLTPASAITVANGATGYITVKALNAGSATITLTGVNSASVGQGGSTYTATIELTVAPESGEHTHRFGEASYVWSDDFSSCTATRSCSCGEKETETVTSTSAHKDATCKAEGSDTYTVTFTNAAFEAQTKVVSIAKLAHTPGEAVIENEVKASCKAAGSYDEVIYCTECKEELSRVTKTVDKLEHTPGETVIENEVKASCKAAGSYDEVVYCTECKEELSRVTKTVDKLEHTPGEAVIENEIATSCKAAGSYDEVVYCTECKEELSRDTKTVDKLAHKTVTDAAVEATCTATGLTEGSHCSECGETLVAQEVVPMKAHTPGEAVIENTVEATCSETGSYDEVVYCSVCKTELSRVTKTIDKIAHTPVTDAAVEATCTETGLTEGSHCSECGEILVAQEVVPMKAHIPGEVMKTNVVPETCLAEGSYTELVFCAECNALISRETKSIPVHAHTAVADAGKAATCTATGLTEGSHCSECGLTLVEQKVIPVKDHTPGETKHENVVNATCTVAGSYDEVVYCADCGAVLSTNHVTGKVLPHTPGEVVIENVKDATCKTAGSCEEVIYCTACKAELSRETKVIDKLAHTPVVDAAVEATCTEAGLTEGCHCSVCGEILIAQEIVPMKAHTPGAVEIENVKAATCQAAGSCEEVTYCTVCKAELSRVAKVIDKLAHTPVADAAVAATCTATGLTEGSHCSVCGETLIAQEIVPMKAHAPGAVVIENMKAATCKAAGSCEEVTYCTVCKAELSRVAKVIDKLAHTPAVDAAVAGTCTAAGLTEGIHCSVCGEILVAQETVPALGHSFKDGKCTVCGADDPSFKNPFTDIGNLNASFQKSILWAYNSGIASGKTATTFDPNGECTRGQVVTFLWRAAGKPEPTPVASNPYSDVKEGAYYYKAILWAAEQGITAGYADGTFKPDQVVSRAQFITFLWRYEGKPMPTGSTSPFKDVTGGAYYNAILWGAENGIVTGYSDGTFHPNSVCTRAHVLTFLYRYGVEE